MSSFIRDQCTFSVMFGIVLYSVEPTSVRSNDLHHEMSFVISFKCRDRLFYLWLKPVA